MNSFLRINQSDAVVDEPTINIIPNWPQGKGDGVKYIVDLGNPILTLNNEDLYNEEVLIKKKKLLREFLVVEQQNLTNRKLNIYHFQWARQTQPNEHILYAWIFLAAKHQQILDNLFFNLGPSLISLAIHLKENDRLSEALLLKPFLAQIPEHQRHPALVQANPEFLINRADT
ncbi:MAG: hypothetical protein IPO07_02805 [Haliscomenobacter sp.]|nr:hypothetical protein [Haliscomenobacter sp.]MBK9487826.1 hypothetical protein [Haliscomenobacter sp.]